MAGSEPVVPDSLGTHPIRSVHARGLLSFGPDAEAVELGPLNVIIGPNGSGKSNLLELLSLVAALPTDLREPLRRGGGALEWLWKGGPQLGASLTINHHIGVWEPGPGIDVVHDLIFGSDRTTLYVDYEGARSTEGGMKPRLWSDQRSPGSRLARRSHTDDTREMEEIRSNCLGIWVYQDWDVRRGGRLRVPQPADLPDDFLLESGENLGMMLNALARSPAVLDALQERLRRFHPGFKEVRTITQGGTVQIFFREEGLDALVPATRLSDGTLRYLALLVVLLHPSPPKLIGLEEPELGLHPDLIRDLAELLRDASTRTQVVVTTHSEHLIDALSDKPEAVMVAERTSAGTRIQRLDPAALTSWLERYGLGELWMKGVIGGTRW